MTDSESEGEVFDSDFEEQGESDSDFGSDLDFDSDCIMKESDLFEDPLEEIRMERERKLEEDRKRKILVETRRIDYFSQELDLELIDFRKRVLKVMQEKKDYTLFYFSQTFPDYYSFDDIVIEIVRIGKEELKIMKNAIVLENALSKVEVPVLKKLYIDSFVNRDISIQSMMNEIVCKFYKLPSPREKRELESKNIETFADFLDDVDFEFVELCGIEVPDVIVTLILDFLPRNLKILMNVGRVCKQIYLKLIIDWKSLKINGKSVGTVSILVLQNITVLDLSTITEEELSFVFKNLEGGKLKTLYLRGDHDFFESFFKVLMKYVLEDCSRKQNPFLNLHTFYNHITTTPPKKKKLSKTFLYSHHFNELFKNLENYITCIGHTEDLCEIDLEREVLYSPNLKSLIINNKSTQFLKAQVFSWSYFFSRIGRAVYPKVRKLELRSRYNSLGIYFEDVLERFPNLDDLVIVFEDFSRTRYFRNNQGLINDQNERNCYKDMVFDMHSILGRLKPSGSSFYIRDEGFKDCTELERNWNIWRLARGRASFHDQYSFNQSAHGIKDVVIPVIISGSSTSIITSEPKMMNNNNNLMNLEKLYIFSSPSRTRKAGVIDFNLEDIFSSGLFSEDVNNNNCLKIFEGDLPLASRRLEIVDFITGLNKKYYEKYTNGEIPEEDGGKNSNGRERGMKQYHQMFNMHDEINGFRTSRHEKEIREHMGNYARTITTFLDFLSSDSLLRFDKFSITIRSRDIWFRDENVSFTFEKKRGIKYLDVRYETSESSSEVAVMKKWLFQKDERRHTFDEYSSQLVKFRRPCLLLLYIFIETCVGRMEGTIDIFRFEKRLWLDYELLEEFMKQNILDNYEFSEKDHSLTKKELL